MNEVVKKSRRKNIVLGIVFGINLITILPAPLFCASSLMMAAGGPRINFADFKEMVIRLLWLCLAVYPVFIIAPFVYGWMELKKNESVKGYVFTVLSGVISLGFILFLVFTLILRS